MALKDFPGPKAQIPYAEGKADSCDLMELFAMLDTGGAMDGARH